MEIYRDFTTHLSPPLAHKKTILLLNPKKLHTLQACLWMHYKTNIIFPLCFLQIFAYMDQTSSQKNKWDLQALRFLSINSIIDPWVFAILRPPVLRIMRSVLCCRVSLRTRDAAQTSCSIQSNANKQIDLRRQQLRSASLASIWKIILKWLHGEMKKVSLQTLIKQSEQTFQQRLGLQRC